MNGVRHTKGDNGGREIYFWTGSEGFYGAHFNVGADYFYKICKEKRFFVELDLPSLPKTINTDMKSPEEIAQWVINRRFPKSELDHTSDHELYYGLVKEIKEYASQFRAPLPTEEEIAEAANIHSIEEANRYEGAHPCPEDYPREEFKKLMRLFKTQSEKDFNSGVRYLINLQKQQ